MRKLPIPHSAVLRVVLAFVVLLCSARAFAAPEAHILRIDPRAASENGNPILTTVIEVVESKRVSDAVAPCAELRGNEQLDCQANALEKPYALYTPFPFPAANAVFTVKVDGTDNPAKYISHTKWGDSLQQPGVGTAWMILIDADRRMGGSFEDAKAIADRFVTSMGPNDIVNVMFFDDRGVVRDSKWMPAAQKARAQQFVGSVPGTFASRGRNRSLLTILKSAATDSFKALGNTGDAVPVPLHQAMVVLSNGFGGADPATTGPGALQLQQYLTGGRFPEDNTAMPKAPVPVISVYLPYGTYDEFRQNSLEFMQNLPNPEIGGFFSIVRQGQGGARAGNIVESVRTRFSKMHVVKWRVSCIAPTITQTFGLVFNNVKPPILGDNTFKDVPVGIDPTTWPLDVNLQYTQDMAKRQEGVHPGGKFKVYGEFCWGGDKSRAEVYFLPSGQPLPTLSGVDIEKAKRTQQQLIAMGMKGTATEVSDTYVEFESPDKDKILHGSGNQAVVRLVIFDNKAKRTSGVTADSLIQLKGASAPFPIMYLLGGLLALVVIALLLLVLLRSGGRKRGGGAPPPAPVAASPYGGGYGAPPAAPGYGAPPAGGYGGAAPGGYSPPQPGPAYGSAPAPAPVPPPVNPEFMYGGAPSPQYGAAAPGAVPPNPYGAAVNASRAILQGAAGTFTVTPGVELRAGRDGSQCGILLTEPRVSGTHASVKLESGQLLVRDENSNNGTQVNGNRIAPGSWTPVPNGSLLRFGPVEFSVRLE